MRRKIKTGIYLGYNFIMLKIGISETVKYMKSVKLPKSAAMMKTLQSHKKCVNKSMSH